MLFGPPPPARKYDVSISVIRPSWTAQPHRHQQHAGLLAHRPHPSRLAGDRIREIVVVAAAAGHRLPEAVADLHDLFLLGVLHVGRQRQAPRVVREQRRQVLIDETFEAGAIAIGRDRLGLGDEVRREDAAGDDQKDNSGDTCESHV